jgi:hypothetical protein
MLASWPSRAAADAARMAVEARLVAEQLAVPGRLVAAVRPGMDAGIAAATRLGSSSRR